MWTGRKNPLRARGVSLKTSGRASENSLIFLHFGKVYFFPRRSGFSSDARTDLPPPTPPCPTLQFHLTVAAAARGRLGPRGPLLTWGRGCMCGGSVGEWIGGSFQLQPSPSTPTCPAPPQHTHNHTDCVSLSGLDGPTRLVKRPSDSSVKSVTPGHLFWTQRRPAPSQHNPSNG